MIKFKEIRKGFIDTLPIGISVSIYGLVYGVLGGKAGLSVLEVAAMSLFVFAGASQIAAVQMLALGSNPLSIIITVFIINLRHLLMGASLSPYLKEASFKIKMVSAFFMTDESYAVTYNHFQKNKPSPEYFLGSGLNIYLLWGGAGVLGCIFGAALPSQFNFIFDFAFVAAFIGILVPMIKDFPVVFTVIASGIISLLGYTYIPGKWYIILAGISASFVGLVSENLIERSKSKSISQEIFSNEE
ncbi:MAG TPA: AzlC family ABC transporter permease [Ruminiclostridium sp.]